MWTEDFSTTTYVLLLLIGLIAGLLDSIVGGGGLVAIPALVNLLPQWPILRIIGTNRLSSAMGTSVAAWNYFRQVQVNLPLVIIACVGSCICSYFGVLLAAQLPEAVLKKTVLIVIVLVALYTVFKKDLGLVEQRRFVGKGEWLVAFLVGCFTGFYNGLIGPGTGALMVFAFVSVLGFDFLKSSAISKVTNVSADLSSLVVLFMQGYVVLIAAIPLIVGNVIGSYVGSQLAILKGSSFIRWAFLVVVLALILRQLTI
jgi:uncharacterized protein